MTSAHGRDPNDQLFPRWSNQVLWLGIAAAAGGIVGLPLVLWLGERTPYVIGEQDAPVQPVKFDHRHHVRDDGIDCTYCHATVARAPYAGIPATSLCMGCHGQIWPDSPELAPVRAAYVTDRPVTWERVTRLPDHVFFNHAAHVTKGVGCVECHGRVDRMAQVYAVHELSMSWCLGCHRDPEPRLRPPAEVTNMDWDGGDDAHRRAVGHEIARTLGVTSKTDCTDCHR